MSSTCTELNVSHLIPYLTWRAPFGNTGFLPLIAQIISLYSPNDISITINSIFRKQSNILRLNGFIDPENHSLIIILCGLQKTEIINIPNYQLSSQCTTDDIWINHINIPYDLNNKFIINGYTQIISSSQYLLATKRKIVKITNESLLKQQKMSTTDDEYNKLKRVYGTNLDEAILDMWIQTDFDDNKSVHYVLKRSLNSSFADILQITDNNTIKKLYHFILPDTYIIDKHCCYILLNDNISFVIYHCYDFLTNSCKLGLRYCNNKRMEVNDIEIPFHLLNDTYSETLSSDKVYIMNIAQKYFFYHKQSDQYLLFMDLTYRLNDINSTKSTTKSIKNGHRNSMKFKSSVFMWQFQIDWKNKKIKNIAISGVKINLSLSGIGKYCLLCFDEENGSILIHEKNTSNFIIKRLSDVVKEWNYYLQ